MIKTDNLCKGYTKEYILNNISFELESGKIYGLAGSNGSGKTTLIKCLSGIYKPDKGEVLLDGKTVYNNNNSKEKIGLIFDNHNFLTFSTIKSYSKYYAKYYDSFSSDKFKEMCKKFGLPDNAQIDQLSFGQKKKFQIALVLSRNTEYLIMDEPENGLDNENREFLRDLIRELSDNGMCVIISTHDLVNIENMCDELILIDDGNLRFNGSIDDCLSNIQKWRVKADKEALKGFVIKEDLGNIFTVLTKGEKAENESILKEKGIEIIDIEKVSVADAYTFMRKDGAANG